MTTVAVRLAGSSQSWGEQSRYTRRGSLPYPTYSGLLGLLRCAYGHGRDHEIEQWMLDLPMGIRLDQMGSASVDFHTVNKRHRLLEPGDPLFKAETKADRASPDGQHEWLYPITTMGGGSWAGPLVTYRTYLLDADFLWLIEASSEEQARSLVAALEMPVWSLSLGRKKCVPERPFVMGIYEGSLIEAASAVPRNNSSGSRASVPLHLLANYEISESNDLISHIDLPLHPHPQKPKTANSRAVTRVNPPAETLETLEAWQREHNPHYRNEERVSN